MALLVDPVAAQDLAHERDVPALGHPQPEGEVERREVRLPEPALRHRGAPDQRRRAADPAAVEHRLLDERDALLQRRRRRPEPVLLRDQRRRPSASISEKRECATPARGCASSAATVASTSRGCGLVVVAELDHVLGRSGQQRAREVPDDPGVLLVPDEHQPRIVEAARPPRPRCRPASRRRAPRPRGRRTSAPARSRSCAPSHWVRLYVGICTATRGTGRQYGHADVRGRRARAQLLEHPRRRVRDGPQPDRPQHRRVLELPRARDDLRPGRPPRARLRLRARRRRADARARGSCPRDRVRHLRRRDRARPAGGGRRRRERPDHVRGRRRAPPPVRRRRLRRDPRQQHPAPPRPRGGAARAAPDPRPAGPRGVRRAARAQPDPAPRPRAHADGADRGRAPVHERATGRRARACSPASSTSSASCSRSR